jgi:hypothetical protein
MSDSLHTPSLPSYEKHLSDNPAHTTAFAKAVAEIEQHGFKVYLALADDVPTGLHISFPNGCHLWPGEHECFARFNDGVKNHRADAINYLLKTGRTYSHGQVASVA